MRACTRTHAGAAIFVQSGTEGALQMCVRVRAYITFLVRTCADVRRTSIIHIKSIQIYFQKMKKKKKLKKCAGARAAAKTGVRARASHTIKMCAMCVQVRPKNRAH